MKSLAKKFVLILVALLLAGSLFAQSSEESSSSDELFYINVPILFVYDHADAYVVNYNKGSIGVGEVVLPKEWFKTSDVDKCRVRPLSKNMTPYMTVIYKNGTFQKAYLNMPTNHSESCWKVLSKNADLSDKINTDKGSLKIEY
ncbi:MAG: hypothetical protein K5839_02210 [Treponemataceae bacterium]|nr:hypothetical protein [Treponemataceae bacterium]